ncbi:hypothetical protein GCK32_022630 [Trichostrongylus colubriformis]|uniref:Uncharacterized protein n=1 Tax=Trichostrongylus colubriformis TaxID=6319 RepID=A0AAN8G7U0_TRICO
MHQAMARQVHCLKHNTGAYTSYDDFLTTGTTTFFTWEICGVKSCVILYVHEIYFLRCIY